VSREALDVSFGFAFLEGDHEDGDLRSHSNLLQSIVPRDTQVALTVVTSLNINCSQSV
jgi:hypothetical protein